MPPSRANRPPSPRRAMRARAPLPVPPSTTHPVHVGDPTPGLGEAEVIGGRFEFGNRIVGNAPKMFDADVRLRQRAEKRVLKLRAARLGGRPRVLQPQSPPVGRRRLAQALRQRRARRPTQAAVASGRAHLAGARRRTTEQFGSGGDVAPGKRLSTRRREAMRRAAG